MLTASELTAMQATQVQALPSTGVRTRRAYTPDGLGGQTVGTATASTAVRLAVSLNQPDREILAGRLVEGPLWRVYCAAGFDVKADDLWTIDGRGFEVLAVYSGASYETARFCVCVERL